MAHRKPQTAGLDRGAESSWDEPLTPSGAQSACLLKAPKATENLVAYK